LHPRQFIDTFSTLGRFLNQFTAQGQEESRSLASLNERHYQRFRNLIAREHFYNPWFTEEFVKKAIRGIVLMLDREVLHTWLDPYRGSLEQSGKERTVGLVMAGNIPLVGFHDLMSLLAAGHRVLARPSSKDDRLIRAVADMLVDTDPSLKDRIEFTEGYLRGVDAVIATGSDNSARYFDYYFRDLPHIIRKNRNGVAVLTGQESREELERIGDDIFTFFGLGCRNVTKLYIPESFKVPSLMEVLEKYGYLYQHHKYGNNVDYYRAIYMMNRIPFFDNGVLLVKEDRAIASPVGVVFYERYSDIGTVQEVLVSCDKEIQCCVSVHPAIPAAIPPGTTQQPMPWDYADGIDTIRFLTELK
jgi:hypothetical protein